MATWFKVRSYIDQYAELLGATVHTENSYNFLLELPDGSQLNIIIKARDNIAWFKSPLFLETFGSLAGFLQRLLGNYRIASLLGIGPLLHGYHIVDDTVLILILDYLAHPIDHDILRDNHEAITAWIKKIHAVGIYHGDLDGSNLRMNARNELRMINLDTMFFRDEKDLPIIVEWINRSVSQTMDEFIREEEELTFMNIRN